MKVFRTAMVRGPDRPIFYPIYDARQQEIAQARQVPRPDECEGHIELRNKFLEFY